MRTVFADSLFYFAFLNPRDRAHAFAMEAARDRSFRVVTTEYVLLELMDGLSSPRHRLRTSQFIRQLYRSPSTQILAATPDSFRSARSLYEARPDKSWSLTECTSFVVMQDMGIAEALTGDAHFEQAGFQALLKV